MRAAPSLSRDLPWTNHEQPWAIFVAEVMLQQTPVSRVLEPWRCFVERFATPSACADAPQSDVLRLWSGLGYPRRARNLHLAATVMRDVHDGQVPRSIDELLALPGVGNYTANAVASFAFSAPFGVLDTNTGRVLARCVAGRRLARTEAQALMNELLDARDSARFNQAVLDLGAQFCRSVARCENCPVKRLCAWQLNGGEDPAVSSAAVSKSQPRFVGSDRQVRGQLIRELSKTSLSRDDLTALIGLDDRGRVTRLLRDLVSDGLVSRRGSRFELADR